jgi:hypothetical protein
MKTKSVINGKKERVRGANCELVKVSFDFERSNLLDEEEERRWMKSKRSKSERRQVEEIYMDVKKKEARHGIVWFGCTVPDCPCCT